MKVNIPKDNDDIFYRYQRNIIEIENVKLGIKIKNLDLISKQIYLEKNFIFKNIKKKLGCNIKNEVIYLKGNSINSLTNKLEDIIEELIKNNLCEKCLNPEVVKNVCQACGNSNI